LSFQPASGTVLNRRIAGEGDLLLTLFLRGTGTVFASARGGGAGKVRFGGGTEPLVWGAFSLYESKGRRHVRSVDVADAMPRLRGKPEALLAAARWARLLTRRLPMEHPDDQLLANLYWCMKLLDEGFPAPAAEWRFLWRWLKSWGLAPGWEAFRGPDTETLRRTAAARTEDLAGSPGDWGALAGRAALFADAARRAEFFLRET
jgi:DNA repair protein RecO (recombination protein O)